MSKVLFINYDNESKISFFPLAQAYLAAALEEAGHKVSIWQQDIHHWPDNKITEYLDQEHFDVVGISAAGGYYQYARLKALAKAINRSKQRPFFVVGGHMCAPAPEYFINKFNIDAICLGEGEITIVNIINALENKTSLEDVKGIAFKQNDIVIINEKQSLIQNLDDISWPAYHLFPIEYYRLRSGDGLAGAKKNDFTFPMITSRGCIFKCAFCYRLDKGFRQRSVESIIEEIEFLYKEYNITYILFDDELTISNTQSMIEFSNAFIKAGINKKITWGCNGRLNFITKELIDIMKKAGCVFINYGIESYNDNVLRLMKKNINTKIIDKAVQITLDAGIHPGLNMLWNNQGDNKKTLQRNVEFLLTYDDFIQVRTIRPVTPYPGSPLFYTAIKLGLLNQNNPVEDFYESKHTNSDLFCVNFMDMNDEDAYTALYLANKTLLKNYHNAQWQKTEDDLQKLYVKKDRYFRGFRLI